MYQPMLRSGEITEVHRNSGTWAFVDVGFSRESKTAALLIQDESPRLLTFSQLRETVRDLSRQPGSAINLVLEAPLSAAFTAQGNPAGRIMEKRETNHRYWYGGLGCQVTLAAAYLLRAVIEGQPKREIRLFEAFVSFKSKHTRSSHGCDVCAMRTVVWNENRGEGDVLPPESLLGPHAEHIESSFAVFGFDLGVPPVIVANPG
jgi:hypothetical protein